MTDPAPITAVTESQAIGLYGIYALIAVGVVVYLARTLHRSGALFLVDVFDDERLAGAVNHLLVIGFYLVNLGYAFLLYQLEPNYASMTDAFNHLVVRLGWLLASLGVLHLLNMLVFWRIRTHRERADRRALPRPPINYTPPPPLAPTGAR